MAEKHSVKVLIDGRVVTLAGYESDDYLQRVAYYLNNKIAEINTVSGYGRLNQDAKSMLLALNIADDYFKAKSRADSMEEEIENKDQNAYDVKHDLVSARMEIEKLRSEVRKLEESGKKEENPSEIG